MSGHVHAHLMALYAQDATETAKPWERWQFRRDPDWRDCEEPLYWHEGIEYRRKPKTININGFEVPEPYKEALEICQAYWVANPAAIMASAQSFTAHDIERHWLEAGLVHLTKEAAELHRKALLSFTEVKSCEG